MRLMIYCAALALGEYLAACAPGLSALWPCCAAALALTVLFGFGCARRAWPFLATFLLGGLLFMAFEQTHARHFRERPWMRGHAERRTDAPQSPYWRAVRDDLSRRVAIGLPADSETLALSRAILLGERRRLPAETKRIFVESGTMHVFAISGLHVMAVSNALIFCLALLFIPRRWCALAALPFLWAYVMTIGHPPSAVRAALMATFSAVAPLFWRRPDGLRSWALTFLAVHLVSPDMIVNVGSVLSFAVMLAIVFVCQRVKDRSHLQQACLVSLSAWAVGVPIAAHVFGRVTPGGLFANLVLIPTAGLAVVAGAMAIIVSFVCPFLAAHLNNLCALAIDAMVLLANLVARLPGASYECGSWPILTCVEWYVALALTVYLCRHIAARRRLP